MDPSLITLVIIVSFVVSIAAAFTAMLTDRQGSGLIICWIFLALAMFLITRFISWMLGLAAIVAFIMAVIAGITALVQRKGVAILIVITYLAVALLGFSTRFG